MTALTNDITTLLTAALAKPQCDTTRGALADAMQERDCWTRETILPWVLKWKDNDAPRRLYASWCDANGEPERGEFIKVQCEIAPLAAASREWWGKVVGDEYKRLERLRCRERELLDQHGWQQWQGSCREIIPKGEHIPSCIGFTRGFVSSIACTAADWLAHAGVLTREQPIERVWLTTMPEVHQHATELFIRDEYQLTAHGSGERVVRPARPRGGLNLSDAGSMPALLEREWPGIAFELPDPTHGGLLVPPEYGELIPLLRGDSPLFDHASPVTVQTFPVPLHAMASQIRALADEFAATPIVSTRLQEIMNRMTARLQEQARQIDDRLNED